MSADNRMLKNLPITTQERPVLCPVCDGAVGQIVRENYKTLWHCRACDLTFSVLDCRGKSTGLVSRHLLL